MRQVCRWTVMAAAALLMCARPALAVDAPDAPDTPDEIDKVETASPTRATPASTFETAAGPIHMQTSDGLVRSLRWGGIGGELLLSYRRESARAEHQANLRVPIAPLANRYDHGGLAWAIQLDYGYLRALRSWGAWDLAVGGRYRWNWTVQYYEDFDEEHLYWMNAHELAPAAVASRRLSPRDRVRAELDLPLVALVSRPPAQRLYKIDKLTQPLFFVTKSHEDLHLTTLHEYQAAHLKLRYEHAWGGSVALRVVYSFDLAHASEPRPVWVAVHSLVAGVSFAL